MVTPIDSAQFKKKQQLFVGLNDAIRDHLQEIGVAIICFKNGEPEDIGSGSCIEIAGRYFIATAAHVIEPYRNEELFLITQRERQDWTPMLVGRAVDVDNDVAWLELAPGVEKIMKRRFVGLDRLRVGCAHLERDLAVVYGFPGERIKVHAAQHGLGVQPLCFATNTFDDSERPQDSDESRDIYLAYPNQDLIGADGNAVDGVAAPGLSGGGIWTVEANKTGLWSPESCQLIGIQSSWLRWKWVRGTQIQHWLKLVATACPELADSIRSVHPAI